MTQPLTVLRVEGLPEMAPGDDLAAAIIAAIDLHDGDVVVVAQKVVSKVEGALVDVPDALPGVDARREVARSEAAEIVADAPWALIVRTRHGFVCANAGVDASNVPGGQLSLLPDDPDASARRLRSALRERVGTDVGVIVADTFGRPWRVGQTDVAIGVAGLCPLRDERGGVDRHGAALSVTEAAVADELAAAADLVRTKADGVPVVVIRGYAYEPSEDATASQLIRDGATDLFARGRGMLAAALTDDSWPLQWETGVTRDQLERVQSVAPTATVTDHGPPATLAVRDPFEAGLAAGVLADLGLRVQWRRGNTATVLRAGRPS